MLELEINLLFSIIIITLLNMVFGFKKQNILGCGLVGFSGKGEFNLIAIKTLLLYNSVVRKSTDATGLFTPSMGIVKDVKTPNEFFKIEKYSSLIEERNEVLMGHVRAATVGNKDNKEEAHPWDFGTIVMMHNGTLKNHEKLAEKYGLEKGSWKVDSQVLGAAIKKNFDNKEPFKVLSEYDGAAAIVVYHKERDSLFIYRDDKRTLAYGYIDNNMYISSEPDILEAIGCEKVRMFETYKVYEIKEGIIVHKMKIKTKKAAIRDYVIKTCSNAAKLISLKSYSKDRFTFLGRYTGIEGNLIKPSHLDGGYKLRAVVDSRDVNDNKLITKDKYYSFHSETNPASPSKFKVMGDNNTPVEVYPGMFDFRNFIPIPGGYVKYLGSSVLNDLETNEIYEVIDHVYGTSEVIVYDHNKNVAVQKSLSLVRVASFEEVKKYFEEDGKEVNRVYMYGDNAEVKSSLIIEDKELEEYSDFTIVEEDGGNDDNVDEKITKAEVANENLILSLEMIANEIEVITSDIDFSSVEKERRLKSLFKFIEDCSKDESFLLNLNENTLKNS